MPFQLHGDSPALPDTPQANVDPLHLTQSTLSLDASMTLPSPTAVAGAKSPALMSLPLPSLPLTREALAAQPRVGDDAAGVRLWLASQQQQHRAAMQVKATPRDAVVSQFDSYRSMPYLRSPPGGRMLSHSQGGGASLERVPKLPTLGGALL